MTTSKAPRVSLAAVVVGLVIGLALGSSVAFWLALSTWRHLQQTFQPTPESSPSSQAISASTHNSQEGNVPTESQDDRGKNNETPQKRKAPAQRNVTKKKKAKKKKADKALSSPHVIPVSQHREKKPVRQWTAPTQAKNPWQPSSSARPTAAKQIFHYSESKEAKYLAPIYAKNDAEQRLVSLMFERLWHDHNTSTPKPWLAVKWRSLDQGRRLWVRLRDNVRWHNGTLLTSRDLYHSFDYDRLLTSTLRQKQAYSLVKKVKIINDKEVEFLFAKPLKQPWRLINVWIFPYLKPYKKNETRDRLPLYMRPIGTGPYRYHAKKGRSITLQRYADYWRKTPQAFSTIVMRTITDPHIAINVLRYGGIDVMMDFPVSQISLPASPRNFSFASYKHSRWWSLVCNTRNPILKKASLRRALFSLMSQQLPQLSQVGTEQLLTGPFTPHFPLGIASSATRKTNKTEALHDLRQEGWKSKETSEEHSGQLRYKEGKPFRLRLLVSVKHRKLKPILEQLQKTWRGYGLDVRLRWASPFNFRRYVRYLRNFELALMEWDIPENHVFKRYIELFYASRKFNYGAYYSPTLLLLLKQAIHNDNPVQTLRYFEQVLQQLEKDRPHLWLWYLPGQMAISTKLGGVRVDPDMPFRHILQWFKLP